MQRYSFGVNLCATEQRQRLILNFSMVSGMCIATSYNLLMLHTCSPPLVRYATKDAEAGAEDTCYQWPGKSGKNAMRNGVCGADNDSYSYDQ